MIERDQVLRLMREDTQGDVLPLRHGADAGGVEEDDLGLVGGRAARLLVVVPGPDVRDHLGAEYQDLR